MEKGKDFWMGWIVDITDNTIMCRLRKNEHKNADGKYNLDRILTIGRDLLTKEQSDLITMGLIIRFDVINETINMMKENGEWC